MINYVNIDLKTEFNVTALRENLSKKFPDFRWRCGDSDLQGTYVSGMNNEKIKIQIWNGVDPAEMSVSFTGSQLNEPEKKKILDDVIYKLIPLIGKFIKIEYF